MYKSVYLRSHNLLQEISLFFVHSEIKRKIHDVSVKYLEYGFPVAIVIGNS